MTSVIKFEGTNMACMGGDEIMKEFENNTQQPCDDAISRDMALEKMADYVASGYADSAEDFEEYSKIICQLPPVTPQAIEQKPCEDCISRQAVLDEIDDTNRRGGFGCKLSYTRCRGHIEQLPPVTQKPETVTEFADRCRECGAKYGKWIFVDKAKEHAHCSECDYGNVDLFDGRPHNYCPNCGAKMAEPQESEEV